MRVGRDDEQMATVSLSMLTKLSTYKGQSEHVSKVRILHVGGTLEKVEKAMKKMTEAWLEG